MTTIRRLTDSTLVVRSDDHATLFDPGFHTFTSGEIDLGSIGDIDQVLITHEHRDHVNADFVQWLLDRRSDLVVVANQAVVDILAASGIEATTAVPDGVLVEDVLHAKLPNGATPPNRAYTVDGVFTHPGDSYEPENTAPVLALPLMTPWGSVRGAVGFARRIRPERVIPIHDFYMTSFGREWMVDITTPVLEAEGIEVIPLGWGESFTV
jgi:L-ascorbate metabolism protein UlaG (beta-lactamase superfamily)